LDLDALLNGSVTFTKGMLTLVFTSLSVLTGLICFFLAGKMCFAQAAGQRQGLPLFGPVASHIMIGYFFLILAGFSADVVYIFAGGEVQDPSNALSYLPPQLSQGDFWKRVTLAIVHWVAMFGGIAIYRGLLLWRDMSSGHANQNGDLMWRGFWHIIGGAVALNIGGLWT
jgi:hypothetical protein